MPKKIDDELEEVQEVEEVETAPEPTTTQEAIDQTAQEVERDAVFAELVAKDEEPTVAELRQMLGANAEGLSDEELVAEWQKAVGEVEGGEKQSESLKLDFPLYDDKGNKIDDATKVAIADLLGGKLQFGYTALGKEVKKNITDLLRVASLGHYNETRMQQLTGDRNTIYQQLQELRKTNEQWAAERQTWSRVLEAAQVGNIEPLKKLIEAYGSELGKEPAAPASDPMEREWAQAGQQYVLETVVPYAEELAKRYGAKATEITNAFIQMVDQEPVELLSQARLDAIMQYEIPALLERAGYKSNGQVSAASVDPKDAEIAELKKQLAAASANKENATTDRIRKRKVPPAGGGTPSSGNEMPAFKSRAEAMAWLRGESE